MTYTKKIKIVITSIITSLLIVASSFNQVKAIEFNTPVQYIEASSTAVINGYQVNGTWVNNAYVNSIVVGQNSTPAWINALTIGIGGTWYLTRTSGDVIEVSITLSNYTRSGVNLDTLSSETSGNCSDYFILDYSVEELSDQTSIIKLVLKPSYAERTFSSFSIINNPGSGCSAKNWIYLWQDSRLTVNYVAHYRITDPSASNQSIINAINNQSQNLQNIVNEQRNTTNAINNNTNAINNINEQQTQAGQQAQSDGQTGSTQSQTEATQGTQSLLSAITGFVGIISNATPTNCRITGNMGALDLGSLDFCQDNPPAIVTTIGTLILIAITIPITIWVIKKIISMFRSFTNG